MAEFIIKYEPNALFNGSFSVFLKRKYWFDKRLEYNSVFCYGQEGALSRAKKSLDFWEDFYG